MENSRNDHQVTPCRKNSRHVLSQCLTKSKFVPQGYLAMLEVVLVVILGRLTTVEVSSE